MPLSIRKLSPLAMWTGTGIWTCGWSSTKPHQQGQFHPWFDARDGFPFLLAERRTRAFPRRHRRRRAFGRAAAAWVQCVPGGPGSGRRPGSCPGQRFRGLMSSRTMGKATSRMFPTPSVWRHAPSECPIAYPTSMRTDSPMFSCWECRGPPLPNVWNPRLVNGGHWKGPGTVSSMIRGNRLYLEHGRPGNRCACRTIPLPGIRADGGGPGERPGRIFDNDGVLIYCGHRARNPPQHRGPK